MSADHDPLAFATSLSAKLATRSRHVCVFLGAGIGRACGLPDIAALKNKVLARLTEPYRTEFNHLLGPDNLEQGLSRLRRVAALLQVGQNLDGLTALRASELDALVCKAIVAELDIGSADLTPVDYLASWAARCNYLRPLEIFTVNYDLLLETALEKKKVPYFDGFIGALRAQFHTDLVENSGTDNIPAFYTRLWKLHGSVNWEWEAGLHQVVRLGHPVPDGKAAAIYPSDAKYEESRRVPFSVLQDRFRRALNEPESLVLISGYSFGDEHLNELIFDAATRRQRSEYVVFFYDDIPTNIAIRALSTPNLQIICGTEAILCGVRANWSAPTDINPNLWKNDQLTLRDFTQLAHYLALSTSYESLT